MEEIIWWRKDLIGGNHWWRKDLMVVGKTFGGGKI